VIAFFEALHYRCLRYVQRPLGRMQILIGPNGSGKTTFLDALGFLGTLVRDGLHAAFEERTTNPVDLVWGRNPDLPVELAIEARLPPSAGLEIQRDGFPVCALRDSTGLRTTLLHPQDPRGKGPVAAG
jgi:predicted ATPase